MQLTGQAAQFGRGVQEDVASKLLTQFADCLEKEILGENVQEESEPAEESTNGSAAESEEAEETAASANGSGGSEDSEEEPEVRKIEQESEVEPLDLGAASYEAVLKRAAPVAVGAVVLLVVIWLARRRS
jgi:hypothetical protein